MRNTEKIRNVKGFRRKLTAALLAVLTLCAALLTGCANNTSQNTSGKKYSIVCTIFPEYDWIRNVLGDKAEEFDLTMLLKSGTDLHSYQPSAADIAKISRCDLFVYIGGTSDSWVEDTLREAVNKDMKVINLLDVLGDEVKQEEIVEGMEHVHDEDEEHAHDAESTGSSSQNDSESSHDDHDHEESSYDEHIWLSLNNAKKLVAAITEAVAELDAENANVYNENCSSYTKQLTNLDNEYKAAVKSAAKNTVLFGDRFPFRYMTEDYNLEYYAAFTGCSAETEASFETVTFLAGKLDELNLNTVLIIENSDEKLAKTIIQNSKSKNQQILVLNSLQSVTDKDIKNGVTYLSVMQDNLEILKQALN